jgi:hypothetical protein
MAAKQLDSQLLILSSNQRDKNNLNENNADFTLHAGNNDQLSNLVSAYVLSAQIPNVWTNIVSGRNRLIVSAIPPSEFTENTIPLAVIDFPAEWFTKEDFETLFKATLESQIPYATTVLFVGGKLTLTISTNVYIWSPTYGLSGDLWGHVLGIPGEFLYLDANLLYISPNPPNYSGMQGVFVECTQIGEGRSALVPKSLTGSEINGIPRSSGTSQYESICAYVPMTGVEHNNYALYTCQDPNDSIVRFRNKSNKQLFRVRILDTSMKPLYISPNYDVTVILRITYEYK